VLWDLRAVHISADRVQCPELIPASTSRTVAMLASDVLIPGDCRSAQEATISATTPPVVALFR
jgi:hypothetical protein